MRVNKVEMEEDSKTMLALFATIFIAISVLALLTLQVSGEAESGNNTEYGDYDNNFTIPFNNETLPPCLGKNISVLIRNVTQTHKENLLRIRLQRRLMLNLTCEERLRILNQTRSEARELIQERQMEMERLREMLRQGNITQEEYIMEMNRIMLEIRTRLRLLQETSKEALKELQKNISEENKKFAEQIVDENRRFQQEMKQLHKRIKEEIKEEVKNQKQNKNQDKNSNKGSGKK